MSAFVVDVHDLHQDGSKEIAAAEPVEGLETELAGVPGDRPVRVDVLLEPVDEGILARGAITGRYDAVCRRCLTETSAAFDIEVAEVFRPAHDVWEEGYVVRDGNVDLRPMVRDNVLLTMPVNPLCSPDCAGLCPMCGVNRNTGRCDCPPETPADQWAPLRRLLDR